MCTQLACRNVHMQVALLTDFRCSCAQTGSAPPPGTHRLEGLSWEERRPRLGARHWVEAPSWWLW